MRAWQGRAAQIKNKEGMAMAEMVITVVDAATRKIKVERVQGANRQEILPGPPTVAVPGGVQPIGRLFVHRGSDCITLDIGGGAVYQICF
jgi:hypothetical protein